MHDRIVRIGGAAAHWMDSVTAVPQLLRAGLDYLLLDYLSEGAMGILARIQQQYPQGGFPPDIATVHIGPHLSEIMGQGVKVVANAGGLNPHAAAAALQAAARTAGVEPRIAIVLGDDLRDRHDAFRRAGIRDMDHGGVLPEDPALSINAYLGAFPIATALARGADIVLTGRVSDSSLALGPLIHEFGWTETDYDRLAAGTLAGHLLECGCHATGGTFTDWELVADGWSDMGFPLAECRADGSFILTKPNETGGLVSRGTVAEQMLYEVSDPQAYHVADVVCDFSQVKIVEVGPDRVQVSGARGYPPSGFYKVTLTHEAGWRAFLASPIVGFDAPAKARWQGAALVERVSRLLRERNLPEFSRSRVEAIGAGDSLGERHRSEWSREVILRVIADHPMKDGAELFIREQHAAMTAMSVGTSMALAMTAQPLTGVLSFLVPRGEVPVSLAMGTAEIAVPAPAPQGAVFNPSRIDRPALPPTPPQDDDDGAVELIRLAWGRSGDKGGSFNVGIIARRSEFLPFIAAALDPSTVAQWFAHCFEHAAVPKVDRFYLPGIAALNFVFPDALGGSILNSDRLDPVAKTMAQQLLAMPVRIPRHVLESLATAKSAD